MDVACILFIPKTTLMTIKVSAVENEIGRVKCYQSKVKENQLLLKIWWSAIPGGVDTYTPGGVELLCTPHTQ